MVKLPQARSARKNIDGSPVAPATRSSEPSRSLFETAFRGLLAVGLYIAFPAFSDIYRLWRRQAGVVPGELAPEAFEYPPVAAAVWEPLSWLPSARWAVFVNGILMTIAAVGVTWILLRRQSDEPVDVRLWVASPALLFLLPMNWDVGVALIVTAGLALAASEASSKAGFVFGVGVAWKVAPGSVVLPILPLLTGWRRRLTLLTAGGVAIGLSYAAYILLRPDIWRIHLDFASSRDDYQEGIWGVLDVIGGLVGMETTVGMVNALSLFAVAAGLLATTVWVAVKKPTFAEAAALGMTVFLLFNKVFKPAYVLWLVPLLALAGARRTPARVIELSAVAHFAAVFFPLPQWILPAATVVRVLAMVLVIRDVVSRHSQPKATQPAA